MNVLAVLDVGARMLLFLLAWRIVQIWAAKSHPSWAGAMSFYL